MSTRVDPIENPDDVRVLLREALECLDQVVAQTGDWRVALEDAQNLVQDALDRLSATDLPAGYRWATEDEMDREDAIVVPRTIDYNGTPYTDGEADIAVPVEA